MKGNGCKISVFKEQRDSKGGSIKASDIYQDMGYNNLSNFSIAFKNKFGKSPKEIETKNKRNYLKTNKLRFVAYTYYSKDKHWSFHKF
jgi:AraC-like DNA-binding protein